VLKLRTIEELICEAGDLSPHDLDALAVLGPGVEGALGAVRIKHHRIAQLAASGMQNVEIAEILGMSQSYISILLRSPAVQGLVNEYLRSNWTEVEAVTRRARLAASSGIAELHRRIETNPNLISTKDLANATLGLLDRGGITQKHAVLHFGLSPKDIGEILRKAAEHDESRVVEIVAEGDGESEVDRDGGTGTVRPLGLHLSSGEGGQG
jgi:predicted transcriptional regulator